MFFKTVCNSGKWWNWLQGWNNWWLHVDWALYTFDCDWTSMSAWLDKINYTSWSRVALLEKELWGYDTCRECGETWLSNRCWHPYWPLLAPLLILRFVIMDWQSKNNLSNASSFKRACKSLAKFTSKCWSWASMIVIDDELPRVDINAGVESLPTPRKKKAF